MSPPATGASGVRSSIEHAWLITQVELRRSWRRISDTPRQLVGLAITGLFMLPVMAVAVGGAYAFGMAAGTDSFVDHLSIARMVVAGLAAFVTLLVIIATIQEYGKLEEPEAVLTAIPHYEAVFGLLLLNYVSFVGLAAIPIVGMAIAFAIGASSFVSAPIIAIVLFAVVALSTTLGFAVGQAVRTVGARVAFVARFKTIIGVLAFIAYFGLLASGSFATIFEPVLSVLEKTPLGWLADLALVAAPDPSIGIVRPAAAAVVLLAGIGLSMWLAVRLSGVLWYTESVRPASENADNRSADRASSTDGTPRTNIMSTGIAGQIFGGYVSQPTLQIALKSWRRTYRSPLKLQYAVIPVFFLIAPVQESVETGDVVAVLPVLIAIIGAWATGTAFTLNPLGDEGSVLPITLTSGVSGRRLLGGLVFAGTVVGGLLTVLLAVGLGLASPLDVSTTLVTGTLAGVLCVGACMIGVGVGTIFPKFEYTRISRSRKAILPGFSAFVVYSLVLVVVSLPGLLGGVPLASDWLSELLGVSAQLLSLAGLTVTTVLVGMTGWFSLRSAAEKIDGYTPDR
ncbi:hypothetical protein [Halocatena marina]|uniref:hypothetical protein n=1 Tax=Halocatena marina TaxID=2934937 RepID=UPI002224252A|nr:hypothetical protein [Halocatena marina]